MRRGKWGGQVCLKISASVRTLALTIRRNVNIPWPTQGMGDGDYLYAFQEVIMPIAYEFEPDLVIS
jgi:acetoin utilization deacetylase AcuC-like enzyme